MTSADYMETLRSNDSPSTANPAGFDILKSLDEVKQVRASLEPCLGYKPVLDDQMQDATHFAELQLQPQISRELHAVIRFSKFGRLATILFPEKLSSGKLPLVLQELEKHRYRFIPSAVLELPYDGKAIGIDTWMTRFFHWP